MSPSDYSGKGVHSREDNIGYKDTPLPKKLFMNTQNHQLCLIKKKKANDMMVPNKKLNF